MELTMINIIHFHGILNILLSCILIYMVYKYTNELKDTDNFIDMEFIEETLIGLYAIWTRLDSNKSNKYIKLSKLIRKTTVKYNVILSNDLELLTMDSATIASATKILNEANNCYRALIKDVSSINTAKSVNITGEQFRAYLTRMRSTATIVHSKLLERMA